MQYQEFNNGLIKLKISKEKKVDVIPPLLYNIIYMSVANDDFVNWQSVLENCFGLFFIYINAIY